jgi:hypothetical protein
MLCDKNNDELFEGFPDILVLGHFGISSTVLSTISKVLVCPILSDTRKVACLCFQNGL